MKINISIVAMALAVSGTSFGRIAQPLETKTLCLNSYELSDGSTLAGGCDASANNQVLGAVLLDNGCAEGQVALSASRWSSEDAWSIEIGSCLPPNVVQL